MRFFICFSTFQVSYDSCENDGLWATSLVFLCTIFFFLEETSGESTSLSLSFCLGLSKYFDRSFLLATAPVLLLVSLPSYYFCSVCCEVLVGIFSAVVLSLLLLFWCFWPLLQGEVITLLWQPTFSCSVFTCLSCCSQCQYLLVEQYVLPGSTK